MSSQRYTPRYSSDIFLGAFEKWDLLTDAIHSYLIVRWGNTTVDHESACSRDSYAQRRDDPEELAFSLRHSPPEVHPAFGACMRAYDAYFLDPSISPNSKVYP